PLGASLPTDRGGHSVISASSIGGRDSAPTTAMVQFTRPYDCSDRGPRASLLRPPHRTPRRCRPGHARRTRLRFVGRPLVRGRPSLDTERGSQPPVRPIRTRRHLHTARSRQTDSHVTHTPPSWILCHDHT